MYQFPVGGNHAIVNKADAVEGVDGDCSPSDAVARATPIDLNCGMTCSILAHQKEKSSL